jgi:LmbE family N-acetylglucosaminyl deacetylase
MDRGETRSLGACLTAAGPHAIPALPLDRRLRLLYLAPHPDDFDANAVTLRYLRQQGHPLQVGVVRTGSGVEAAYRPGLTLAGMAELREHEQRASARRFGLPDADLTFLTLAMDPEDQPLDTPTNRDAVAAFVLGARADLVFLPHGNDTNSGHRVMSAFARQTAGRAGRPLALCFNRDPKTIALRMDLYTPFGAEAARWKAELLRCHDSQHQRNLRTRGAGFDDRILNADRQTARELGLADEFAEAFECELHEPHS